MQREGSGSAAGLCALVCLTVGCSGGRQGGGGGGLPQPATLSAKALADEALFHDSSLSASGRQSCATCHVPERAFTAAPVTDRGRPVPLGGRDMDLPGFRNAPSLVDAALIPAFFVDEGTPTGGFFRDGRASDPLHRTALRRWSVTDPRRPGDRRPGCLPVHADRRLRPEESRRLQRARAVPAGCPVSSSPQIGKYRES